MIRRILRWPDPILREVAQPILTLEQAKAQGMPEAVMFDTERLYGLADDLAQTMAHHHGAGLAAMQIGERVALICIEAQGQPLVVANPIVVAASGDVVAEEGCLSFTDRRGRSVGEALHGPTAVIAGGQKLDGSELHARLFGIEARAFAHEVAHVNGRVILDRMSSMVRRMFLKRMEK
jgi:peptide deformylase